MNNLKMIHAHIAAELLSAGSIAAPIYSKEEKVLIDLYWLMSAIIRFLISEKIVKGSLMIQTV